MFALDSLSPPGSSPEILAQAAVAAHPQAHLGALRCTELGAAEAWAAVAESSRDIGAWAAIVAGDVVDSRFFLCYNIDEI